MHGPERSNAGWAGRKIVSSSPCVAVLQHGSADLSCRFRSVSVRIAVTHMTVALEGGGSQLGWPWWGVL